MCDPPAQAKVWSYKEIEQVGSLASPQRDVGGKSGMMIDISRGLGGSIFETVAAASMVLGGNPYSPGANAEGMKTFGINSFCLGNFHIIQTIGIFFRATNGEQTQVKSPSVAVGPVRCVGFGLQAGFGLKRHPCPETESLAG